MKKLLFLCVFFLFICGCTNINGLSYDETIQTLNRYVAKTNTYRTGYKYFLPRGVQIEDSTAFNEVLSDGVSIYYLYVDALSYTNKVENNYVVNYECYYSRVLSYQDKAGYVEINLLENNKYLIEIMYNYAKIEVIVEKDNINKSLLTSISILKSIEYNDSIIANLYGNDVLNFIEEEFNIFNTTSSDSTYIQIDDTYQEVEEVMPDMDLIK